MQAEEALRLIHQAGHADITLAEVQAVKNLAQQPPEMLEVVIDAVLASRTGSQKGNRRRSGSSSTASHHESIVPGSSTNGGSLAAVGKVQSTQEGEESVGGGILNELLDLTQDFQSHASGAITAIVGTVETVEQNFENELVTGCLRALKLPTEGTFDEKVSRFRSEIARRKNVLIGMKQRFLVTQQDTLGLLDNDEVEGDVLEAQVVGESVR